MRIKISQWDKRYECFLWESWAHYITLWVGDYLIKLDFEFRRWPRPKLHTKLNSRQRTQQRVLRALSRLP